MLGGVSDRCATGHERIFFGGNEPTTGGVSVGRLIAADWTVTLTKIGNASLSYRVASMGTMQAGGRILDDRIAPP